MMNNNVDPNECRHFIYMKDIGDHTSVCTRCGYEFLAYRRYVHQNIKENEGKPDSKKEGHVKNWPNCKDCKKENLK